MTGLELGIALTYVAQAVGYVGIVVGLIGLVVWSQS